MKNSLLRLSAVALAISGLLTACGGSDSGNGGGTTARPAGENALPAVVTPTTATTGATGVYSHFPFAIRNQPFVLVKEISNGDFSAPEVAQDAAFEDDNVFAIGEQLPFELGKTYLVTMRSPSTSAALYRSNTRSFEKDNCIENAGLTSRACLPEEGRFETLGTEWSAVVDFSVTSDAGELSRPIYASPLTTLVVERARFLRTPSGGSLPLSQAIDLAERSLALNLPITQSGQREVRHISQVNASLETLDASTGGLTGLTLGMLERFAQQLATNPQSDAVGAGYSVRYEQVFASFARDGKFETLQEAASGDSVGLREIGTLLNSALSQHLIKDAPRFLTNAFSAFKADDYFITDGAQLARNRLADIYQDLYDTTSGAVTSTAYVAASDQSRAQDRNITAVAARESGVFFLDSKGEAQNPNKARVQCTPGDFGAVDGQYEVTGVASLEGAILPMILAYSHTDTTAYLIDVRQVGLDNAQTGQQPDCALPTSGFRKIDFTTLSADSPLYQVARQYRHNGQPVTITAASYDAKVNKLLLTTIDGVLSFDVIPTSGGTEATGSLPVKLTFKNFTPFPDNAANVGVGLGVNPVFDNTLAGEGNNVFLSAFDYSVDDTARISSNANGTKGIYALDYSGFNTAPTKPRFLTSSGLDKSGYTGVAQTTALNFAAGVAAFSGITSLPTNNENQNSSYCHTRAIQNRDGQTLYGPNTVPPPLGEINILDATRDDFLQNNGSQIGSLTYFSPVTLPNYQIAFQSERPLLPLPGGLLQGNSSVNCQLGYQGIAFQNRLGNEQRNPSVNSPLLGIAPVQPYEGRNPDTARLANNGQTDVRQFRGVVGLVQARSPRFDANRTQNGALWLPNSVGLKFFTVLPTRQLLTPDTRELVLDDIRSYGVLRLRGSFPKTFGYFLARDLSKVADGNPTNDYSLIEADLDNILDITDTEGDNSTYNVPVNDQDSAATRGPVRVYFQD